MRCPSPRQRAPAVLAGALLLDVLCGAGMALAVPAVAAGMASASESATAALARRSGWPGVADVVAAALVLKPAFAARLLLDAGQEGERALARADLDAARAGLQA